MGAAVIQWFRYARHADVPRLLSSGWVLASDLGPVHGQWSALLQWAGEGDPPLTDPTNTAA